MCLLLFRLCVVCFFFFKQKTAYEMRISDWSSDVCSSDLVRGLGIESLYLFLPAVAVLLWGEFHGVGGFVAHDGLRGWGWGIAALLVLGGALTALPLIGFADAVRRIPYSVVGLLQYIAPTLQLLCGVLLLGEDFGSERAIGFVLIWIALAVYAGDGLLRARRRPLPAV